MPEPPWTGGTSSSTGSGAPVRRAAAGGARSAVVRAATAVVPRHLAGVFGGLRRTAGAEALGRGGPSGVACRVPGRPGTVRRTADGARRARWRTGAGRGAGRTGRPVGADRGSGARRCRRVGRRHRAAGLRRHNGPALPGGAGNDLAHRIGPGDRGVRGQAPLLLRGRPDLRRRFIAAVSAHGRGTTGRRRRQRARRVACRAPARASAGRRGRSPRRCTAWRGEPMVRPPVRGRRPDGPPAFSGSRRVGPTRLPTRNGSEGCGDGRASRWGSARSRASVTTVVVDIESQLAVEQAARSLPAVPRFLAATGALMASMAAG